MVDIMGMFNSIDWGAGLNQLKYWGTILLFTALIGVAFYLVYYYMQFKYKVTVMERRGTGRKLPKGLTTDEQEAIMQKFTASEHSVGKIIKDRAKQYTDKGVIKWKLLKARVSIEPPDFDNIYPGNNLFLYRSGPKTYIPIKFTCGNPSAEFAPIPQSIQFWQTQEIRQAAEDYQKKSTWDKYGNIVVMMGTILLCLILVGVVVYFTYKHANGVSTALEGLTGAIRNVNVIPGVGPR